MSQGTPPSDVSSFAVRVDEVNAPLATVRASPLYWILMCTHSPFVGLAIGGLFVSLKGDRVASLFYPSIGMFVWIATTVIFAAWVAIRGLFMLRWSLTETSLRRGKHGDGLVILFDDIESIVIGLPEVSPLLGLSRQYHDMVQQRRTGFFVRLRGGRVIQLAFQTFHYRGGATLMEEFLRLNVTKVVGRETYSQHELRKFAWIGVNKIVNV